MRVGSIPTEGLFKSFWFGSVVPINQKMLLMLWANKVPETFEEVW